LKQFLFAGLSFIMVSNIMRKPQVAMMEMPTYGKCPSTVHLSSLYYDFICYAQGSKNAK